MNKKLLTYFSKTMANTYYVLEGYDSIKFTFLVRYT